MRCSRGCCRLTTWRNPNKKWTVSSQNCVADQTLSDCQTIASRKRIRKRSGVILFFNNFVLLVQSYNNHWGFPKGAVVEGERYEEAASRELYEETGIFIHSVVIKSFGSTLTTLGATLFVLKIDEKMIPDIDIVKSFKNNDASGCGWVNVSCLVESTDLKCNVYARNFIKHVLKRGFNAWMTEFSPINVLSVVRNS